MKRAEVDEIQIETKRDIIAIKSIEKYLWITGHCLFFRLSINCLWQSSAAPGSSQHGDRKYHSQLDQLGGRYDGNHKGIAAYKSDIGEILIYEIYQLILKNILWTTFCKPL